MWQVTSKKSEQVQSKKISKFLLSCSFKVGNASVRLHILLCVLYLSHLKWTRETKELEQIAVNMYI